MSGSVVYTVLCVLVVDVQQQLRMLISRHHTAGLPDAGGLLWMGLRWVALLCVMVADMQQLLRMLLYTAQLNARQMIEPPPPPFLPFPNLYY